MTPNQLEEAVRNRYNAIGDSFYSSDMIMDLIYQACMEMALEAFVIERKYTTTSTSGTREYAYPTNAFAIRRVEYDGDKLSPVSLESDPKTSTTEQSGTPRGYAVWNEELILFPTPDESSKQIDVYTYNRPQAVTSSSTLEVPAEYHLNIIDFMLSAMYAKDQNQGMSTYHRNLWERGLERIKRHKNKKKNADQYHVVSDVEDQPFDNRLIYT